MRRKIEEKHSKTVKAFLFIIVTIKLEILCWLWQRKTTHKRRVSLLVFVSHYPTILYIIFLLNNFIFIIILYE